MASDRLLEHLAQNLIYKRGLYVLGAGTSAGQTPFEKELAEGLCYGYLQSGSFSAEIPVQDRGTKRATNIFNQIFENYHEEKLVRLPNGSHLIKSICDEIIARIEPVYTQTKYLNELAKKKFEIIGKQSPTPYSYRVFQKFFPSLIINFNLDGLAELCCEYPHQIITPHGSVNHKWGSKEFEKLVEFHREFGGKAYSLPELVLIERETWEVRKKLAPISSYAYEFVAIIGYTFGYNNGGFDDHHSLEMICNDLAQRSFLHRNHRKILPIFVIDPKPEFISETLKETIKSNDVYAVPIRWDKFSEAMLSSFEGLILNSAKLTRNYQILLDRDS